MHQQARKANQIMKVTLHGSIATFPLFAMEKNMLQDSYKPDGLRPSIQEAYRLGDNVCP